MSLGDLTPSVIPSSSSFHRSFSSSSAAALVPPREDDGQENGDGGDDDDECYSMEEHKCLANVGSDAKYLCTLAGSGIERYGTHVAPLLPVAVIPQKGRGGGGVDDGSGDDYGVGKGGRCPTS